jgi:hypothetical protein
VHVSEAQEGKASRTERRQVTASALGAIQVDFPKGHVCVTGSVDGEALRIVLEHLLRWHGHGFGSICSRTRTRMPEAKSMLVTGQICENCLRARIKKVSVAPPPAGNCGLWSAVLVVIPRHMPQMEGTFNEFADVGESGP